MKLLTIVGARPQIIKAAALSRAIHAQFSGLINEIIVHTGQHYDNNMSQVFFEQLDIPLPQYNLKIGSAIHGKQTAQMISGTEEILIKEKPDYLILYGDTNSTLAGAIAASKMQIPIVHIEAGLRSFNRHMPEEINRVVCDHLSALLFSPTKTGFQNLVREGFNPENKNPFSVDHPGIFHCGDIMYDNSVYFAEKSLKNSTILQQYNPSGENFFLATIHRDSNTDIPQNMEAIFKAFLKISEDKIIILPLHPRTKKTLLSSYHTELSKIISITKKLVIIPPVSFLDMIQLEINADLIITDSGGVQKEAYFFSKPCIILRNETEWIEILETGSAVLTGVNYNRIIDAYEKLSTSKSLKFPSIFGNGKAAEFICSTILNNGT